MTVPPPGTGNVPYSPSDGFPSTASPVTGSRTMQPSPPPLIPVCVKSRNVPNRSTAGLLYIGSLPVRRRRAPPPGRSAAPAAARNRTHLPSFLEYRSALTGSAPALAGVPNRPLRHDTRHICKKQGLDQAAAALVHLTCCLVQGGRERC